MVRNERRTAAGGPFNWNLHSKSCSPKICAKIPASEYSVNSCCVWLDFCAQKPKPTISTCTNHGKFDKNCNDRDGNGCQNNDMFLQTNMLSPDMGLYLNFTTDADGRPQGCPGLDVSRWR